MANLFQGTPSGWMSTDGPINVGTLFTVSAATQIISGRYFKQGTANNGLVVTMRLYGAGTTVLATATRTQLASDPEGWVNVPFSSPVNVAPGTTYTIAFRSTGASYFASSHYPMTAAVSAPLTRLENHSVYLYGALGKPTGQGSYTYAIDAVSTGGVTPPAAPPAAVKALDSDQENIPEAWFAARAAEGVKLFVTAGTPWSVAGTETVNTPRVSIQEQFRFALKYGMKIALYTRDPDHYNTGLDAAGPYISALQFFAVDVEPDPGKPVTQAHIDGVTARGVRPVVYAGSGFWADIQGGNTTAFQQYPLWDTDARETFSYANWQANGADLLSPTPVAYGGWNRPGNENLRIGVQQLFDLMLDGVKVDLNSFRADFLVEKPPVVIPEPEPDPVPTGWWTPDQVAAAKARGVNLVINGDMEQGAGVGWPAAPNVSIIPAAKRNGTLGMRVAALTTGTTYLLNQVVPVNKPGEWFYAEYWVRRVAGTTDTNYSGLGFVAQSNDGTTWNTPTIYGELAEGAGGWLPSEIPTDSFVRVAAWIQVTQPGATWVSFAPWIYATPNTYDIDDIFVARATEKTVANPRLRAHAASVVSITPPRLRIHSAAGVSAPKPAGNLRVISVQATSQVVSYALRRNGVWRELRGFLRDTGNWR